ncbi:MAG: hypothetical protein HYR76_01250 [Ignavibacteria bacterium]|nr:hypothetical protein [Ignavibacteria bacterium]MBI3766297.1 hypothetical protein [Ignavibacteriales bacterium]
MSKATFSSTGGVIAAIIASLCCIGPVALALIGVGSIGLFSMLEPYRSYLIGLTVLLLGLAFYFAYRKREVKCEDGSCKVQSSSLWNKIGVWCATLVAAGAIAFPYFGFTASSSPSKPSENSSLILDRDISFFDVPLVCNAAPSIGCGSRAKFILLDLMKDSTVKGAWLNRRGTVMAVVWNEGTSATAHQTVLKSVFSRHELPIEQVSEQDRTTLLEDFKAKDMWYKGSDVDALSIEEAGVIADRILTGVSPHVKFKTGEDKQAFREDVKAIIQRGFLSLQSFNELDDSLYHRIERDVVAAGEKYLGKGNMPDLQILKRESVPSGNEDACCSKESKEKSKSECCSPQTKGTKR